MEKQKLDKDAIKKVVMERIRAGDDFKKTRKFLEKSGIEYTGLKTTFYTWKQELQPEDARRSALTSMAEKREKKEKTLLPTPKAWNKTKQTEADTSVFADVLNEGLFAVIPCPKKGLTKEAVKEINLGGAITGLIVYYTSINLNHPIVVFVSRAIILVLKVRKMCYQINEKVEELKEKARELSMPGVHSK